MLTNYDKIYDKLLSLVKVKVKDPAAQKLLTEMENTDIDESEYMNQLNVMYLKIMPNNMLICFMLM